jgi:hypothetical protein
LGMPPIERLRSVAGVGVSLSIDVDPMTIL